MAESPAHKFGQLIGNAVEAAVEPLLREFAARHGLFLDKKGPRPARAGQKVTWIDRYGNEHDLDFVLESNGTPERIGDPVAFIESAWRRYTRHSRNKVQEIQGAILPLAETHRNNAVFMGAILAGVFTDGALNQLRSLGFSVLFLPYESIIEAFLRSGIDARFDEDTADREFSRRVRAWKHLTKGRRILVSRAVIELNQAEVSKFVDALERTVTRRIEVVRILPLHGIPVDLGSVKDAITFVERYNEKPMGASLAKYEIQIRYTNRDRIEAQFESKKAAIGFLTKFH